MRWYLLKDRRHEGPFSRDQVIEGVRSGRIDLKDYLLPEKADVDQSSFAYVMAGDVVGPDIQAPAAQRPNIVQKFSIVGEPLSEVPGNKMQALQSQFEAGLEANELVPPKVLPIPPRNFPDPNGESFRPVSPQLGKILLASIGCVVIIFCVVQLNGSSEPTVAPLVPAKVTVPVAVRNVKSPQVKIVSPAVTNRVPSGQIQLPKAAPRVDEPAMPINNSFVPQKSPRGDVPVRIPNSRRRRYNSLDRERADEVDGDYQGTEDNDALEDEDGPRDLDDGDV